MLGNKTMQHIQLLKLCKKIVRPMLLLYTFNTTCTVVELYIATYRSLRQKQQFTNFSIGQSPSRMLLFNANPQSKTWVLIAERRPCNSTYYSFTSFATTLKYYCHNGLVPKAYHHGMELSMTSARARVAMCELTACPLLQRHTQAIRRRNGLATQLGSNCIQI